MLDTRPAVSLSLGHKACRSFPSEELGGKLLPTPYSDLHFFSCIWERFVRTTITPLGCTFPYTLFLHDWGNWWDLET